MKSVLVILSHANLSSLQVHESLSATMVLATFGCEVNVLLQDAALSLLQSDVAFDTLKHAFKVASNMVDSFEFYDLTPILVEHKQAHHAFVKNSNQDIEMIDFNADFVSQFDHVLYW
ncbi:hypothetical protein [uncultured Acinetobacter sp.]|uniref:hypothetical protein n=1 Tax=uncultured Acinetobacter sp. TaxID=165433 RepID=UPI00262D8A53|nr:hypothetical protein [uncultured Acinetobacter sp.]